MSFTNSLADMFQRMYDESNAGGQPPPAASSNAPLYLPQAAPTVPDYGALTLNEWQHSTQLPRPPMPFSSIGSQTRLDELPPSAPPPQTPFSSLGSQRRLDELPPSTPSARPMPFTQLRVPQNITQPPWWETLQTAAQQAAQNLGEWWSGYVPMPRSEVNGRQPTDPNSLFPSMSPFAAKPVGNPLGPPVPYDTTGGYQTVNRPGYEIKNAPGQLEVRSLSNNAIVQPGSAPTAYRFQTFYKPPNQLTTQPIAPVSPFQMTRAQEGAYEATGDASQWVEHVRQWGRENLPLTTLGKGMLNTVGLNLNTSLPAGEAGRYTPSKSLLEIPDTATPNVLSHELNHAVWNTYFHPNDGFTASQQFTRDLFDYMRQNPTSDFTGRMMNLLSGVNRAVSDRFEVNLNITPNSTAWLDNPRSWQNLYMKTTWFAEVYADMTAAIQYDIRRMPPQMRRYYPQWATPTAPLGTFNKGY